MSRFYAVEGLALLTPAFFDAFFRRLAGGLMIDRDWIMDRMEGIYSERNLEKSWDLWIADYTSRLREIKPLSPETLAELRHLLIVRPELLGLEPSVLAITGDHSTPAPLASHSWHPVPLLVHSPVCFVDSCQEFTETAATQGHLGTFPASELMGLLLANAGRLAKFGA